jgi:hypothetical protein
VSSSESREDLILSLNRHQLEIIAEAARLDGLELSNWVQQILVDAASSRITRASRQSKPPPNASTNEPRVCWCGNTRDPRGDCDGGCLISY